VSRGNGHLAAFPFSIDRCPLSVVRWFFVVLAAIALSGCDQMYDQASVRPGESPQFLPSTGTMAASIELPVAPSEALRLKNPLEKTSETLAAGRIAYRRFCWPCHGPQFDGQSATVGPSFARGNLNLLDPAIAAKSDGEYFRHVTYGGQVSPPFAGVMTVEERWQVITYLRAVQAQENRGQAPHFK